MTQNDLEKVGAAGNLERPKNRNDLKAGKDRKLFATKVMIAALVYWRSSAPSFYGRSRANTLHAFSMISRKIFFGFAPHQ